MYLLHPDRRGPVGSRVPYRFPSGTVERDTLHCSATAPGLAGSAAPGGGPALVEESQHLVSVIVRAWEDTPEAVGSVLLQTYPHFEIIVVGSPGEEVQRAICGVDPRGRVRVLRMPRAPAAAAWNAGLAAACGRYVAYLDGADRYCPDHLQTLVSLLAGGEHKVAYSDARRVHKVLRDGRLEVVKKDPPVSDEFDADRILFESFIPVSCVMHERTCLDEVGRFDEALAHCEDWDLWIRLSRRYRFAHSARPTCELTRRIDAPLAPRALVPVLKAENALRAKHRASIAESKCAAQIYPCLAARLCALLDAGHEADAIEVLEDLVDRDPGQGAARRDLAFLYAARGEAQRAVAMLRAPGSSASGAPHPVEAERARLEELARLGALEDARLLQEALLARDPGDATGYNNLGVLAYQMGQQDKARALLRLAVQLAPHDVSALRNLARVCIDSGHRVEALRHCLTVLWWNPSDPEALEMKARLSGQPHPEGLARSPDASSFVPA